MTKLGSFLDFVQIAGFFFAVFTVASAFFAPSEIQIGQKDIWIFGVSFKWLLLAIVASLFGNVRAVWDRMKQRPRR